MDVSNDPVVCGSCGARFPVSSLTEGQFQVLKDEYYFEQFADELRMLLKVQEYYRRHPEAEGRIKSDITRLRESDDPEVQERLCAGVPFDQIELSPDTLPEGLVDGEADREVVEYLRQGEFSLGPRLEFVTQEVARLKNSERTVPCPRCPDGRLRPSESWDDLTHIPGDEISWLWPDWHSIDADGTLHVKASGYQGGCHWTGEQVVNPEQPDYDFWRWFVSQKEYHRLFEESELPTIKEEWLRRTRHRT